MIDVQLGIYRHYKGTLYQVFGVAHDANAEELITTRALGDMLDRYPAADGEKQAYPLPLAERIVVVYIPLQLDPAHLGPAMAVRTLTSPETDAWDDVVCGTEGCPEYGKELGRYEDSPVADGIFNHTAGHLITRRFMYLGRDRTRAMIETALDTATAQPDVTPRVRCRSRWRVNYLNGRQCTLTAGHKEQHGFDGVHWPLTTEECLRAGICPACNRNYATEGVKCESYPNDSWLCLRWPVSPQSQANLNKGDRSTGEVVSSGGGPTGLPNAEPSKTDPGHHPYVAKKFVDRHPGVGVDEDCRVCGKDSHNAVHRPRESSRVAVALDPAFRLDMENAITRWFLTNTKEDDWLDVKSMRSGLSDMDCSVHLVTEVVEDMVRNGLMAKRVGKYGTEEVLYDLPRRVWRKHEQGQVTTDVEGDTVDPTLIPGTNMQGGTVQAYGSREELNALIEQDRQQMLLVQDAIARYAQQPQDSPAPAPEHPDTPETGESLSGPRAGKVTTNFTPDNMVWDLLLLVGADFPAPITRADIEGWDDQTKLDVQKWAAAVHLRASDNDIAVPPMPKVLDVPHPGQVRQGLATHLMKEHDVPGNWVTGSPVTQDWLHGFHEAIVYSSELAYPESAGCGWSSWRLS